MSITSHLSTQLFKSVLVIYFAITSIITLIHFGIEYNYTKSYIRDELKVVAKTFEPALQTSLWELNHEQVEAISDGLMNMPMIYGVTILGENSEVILSKIAPELSEEELIEEDISYTFQIHQDFDGKDVFLAIVTIYSDDHAVFNRVKVGFTIILLNAIIKSTALVILFIIAFRKYLERPLIKLTTNVATLDWKSRKHRNIDIEFQEENELYVLQKKFNELLMKISSEEDKRFNLVKSINTKLEHDVKERTRELEELNKRLQKLATTDLLTQLNNRVVLDEALQKRCEVFSRHKKVFSLIMLDIDFFKEVNDKYGHQVGDHVLQEVAAVLKKSTRSIDTVGRWGGEEFLIICDETILDGAFVLAENIRNAIEKHDFGEVMHQTISLGVAQMEIGLNVDQLIKKADDALYEAKKSGRNRTIKSALIN